MLQLLKPENSRAVLHNKSSHGKQEPVHTIREMPLLPTAGEKPRRIEDPAQPNNK